ncbi:MAG: RagB/SusD family nutrient uptake outer membrane protein, partial [Tannerella sp.]|nr:RagB/SusD family nutrient uptake outer membrane protein [Tannerella sp.]
KENIPVSEKGDASMRYREPVDEVVEYIISLLDEAFDDLPPIIEYLTTELGRPTQTVALALKAQVLTYAASPLFNGMAEEPPTFSLIDNRNRELFPQTYDAGKWQKAAEALKTAIDFAHENGHRLYDFRESSPMTAASLSDATINSMQVRGAVTERMNNPEMIWADFSSNTGGLQQACFPRITGGNNWDQKQTWAPPLHIVKQFYTKNGVPIEEDRDWVGIDLLKLRTATDDERFYTQPNQQTLQLHFDREARFYASILFTRGRLFGCGRVTDGTLWHFDMRSYTGLTEMHSSTGYICKKMLNYLSSVGNDGTSLSIDRYPFPLIRLADLYLMYAEALNEAGSTPSGEVYQYVDLVRRRSGLNGVVESWSSHSLNPDKPLTKTGMRDVIRRERMNELAFEGIRFWDLRRWKLAEQYMSQTIQGFDIFADDFYTPVDLYRLSFEKKDYFWPIRQSVLLTNKNLVQNPGW